MSSSRHSQSNARHPGSGRPTGPSASPPTIPANFFPSMTSLPGPQAAPQYAVPLSHPPLLSEMQSQSHRFSPNTRGATHGRSRASYNNTNGVSTGTIPAQAFPSTLLSPVSTPTSPVPAAGTSLPLVNVLNLNGLQESPGNSYQGRGSPSPTPVVFGGGSGSSSTFPPVSQLPPSSSCSQSMDSSLTGYVVDKMAEIESFLPHGLQSEENPTLLGELPSPPCDDPFHPNHPVTVSEKETAANIHQLGVKKPRALTRVVDEPWTQIFPAKTNARSDVAAENEPSLCPAARFGHTAVTRNSTGEMVVFGGRQTGVCYDDLWIADLCSIEKSKSPAESVSSKTMKWRKIPRGNSSVWPSPRAGHTATINEAGTEMLVFGGGTETEFYGQIFSFNFLTEKWTVLTDFCEDTMHRNYDAQVKPRKGHTGVWDEDEQALYVYGGMLSLNDPIKDSTVWRYDRKSNSWAPMPSSGQQPPDRMYHVAGLDQRTKQMYVFGGRTISASPGYPFLGDLFSFNLKTCVWTKIEENPQSSNTREVVETPKPRMCAASLFHNGRFYISHGGHTRYLNDSFEFDVKQKRWFRSVPTPTPLTRPTVVLFQNTITCFGGCDHEIFLNDCHQMKLVEPTLFELCAEWLNDAEAIPRARTSARLRTNRSLHHDPLDGHILSTVHRDSSDRLSTATIPSIILPPPDELEAERVKQHTADDLLPSNVLSKAQRLLSEQRLLTAKDPVVHVHTQHFF